MTEKNFTSSDSNEGPTFRELIRNPEVIRGLTEMAEHCASEGSHAQFVMAWMQFAGHNQIQKMIQERQASKRPLLNGQTSIES